MKRLYRADAVKAVDAGAAEEVEEEGLDGIVGVVGGGDYWKSGRVEELLTIWAKYW